MEDRIITYGGQAVIEGVMMRGQKAFAIAMRAPDGGIVVHQEGLDAIYRSKITKNPILTRCDLIVGFAWPGNARLDHCRQYPIRRGCKARRPGSLPDHGLFPSLWGGSLLFAPGRHRRAGRKISRLECMVEQPAGRRHQASVVGWLYLGLSASCPILSACSPITARNTRPSMPLKPARN